MKKLVINRRLLLVLFAFIAVWAISSLSFALVRRNKTEQKIPNPSPPPPPQAATHDASNLPTEQPTPEQVTIQILEKRAEELRQKQKEKKRRPYHIGKQIQGKHIIMSKSPKWLGFDHYCKAQKHVIIDKEEPFTFDYRNPDFTNTPIHKDRPHFSYVPENVTFAVEHPLVTVVIPFYNTEQIFYGTLKTILQQSLQQIEVIIVNDHSTNPNSISILDELRDGKYDPRIRVVDHETNLGPGAARNTGSKAARADFIYFLDSDDLLEPTSLEKLYFHLLTTPQFAFSKGYSIGYGAFNYLWPYGFEQREKFLKENGVTVHTMIGKQFMEKMGGFDIGLRRGLEDWEFWLKSAENGYWGSTIKEYMDWYLRKTRDQTKQTWLDWDKTADDLKFRQKFPKIYNGQFPNPQRRLNSFDVTLDLPKNAFNHLKKTKPRIMLIIPWCVLGGADKFNINLFRQLYFRDWELTLVTTLDSENKWSPDFLKWTPDVFLLPNFLEMNNFPRFLIYLINSRKPDVVMVSNSEFGYQILPTLRSQAPGPAYVDYTHMEQEDWKNGGYPRYAIGSGDILDLNLVASYFLRDWMIGRGANPQHIRVCYVNVDTNEFKRDESDRARIRTQYGIPPNSTVIMYAARFVDQKQPKVMASVFKQLRDKGLDFYALVAGDGPDKPWVDEFVTKNKLEDRIKLLGPINSDSITPIMSASDIMFLPSEWEGIALAIYEGMSMGLAIVGANVGGQRELFQDRNIEEFGYLVPKLNDPKQTIEKYVSIFEELIPNKALIKSMGKNSREQIVKKFDMDLMGDCMVSNFCYAHKLKAKRDAHEITKLTAQELANRGVEFMKMQEGK